MDVTKYNQLWQLQQEEAVGLVKQLLAADRVIHQQQLGWQWQAPDEGVFISPHDLKPSSVATAGAAGATAAAAASCDGTLQQHSTTVCNATTDGSPVLEDAAAAGEEEELEGGLGSMCGTSRSNSIGGAAVHSSSGSAEVSRLRPEGVHDMVWMQQHWSTVAAADAHACDCAVHMYKQQ